MNNKKIIATITGAAIAAMIDKTLETLEKRKEAGTEKISVVQKGDKK